MTIQDKKKLVHLLHCYEDELLKVDEANKESLSMKGHPNFVQVKALYNHARIISTKLSKEISDKVATEYGYGL